MKKRWLSLLLGVGLAGSASAGLLINEGFESGDLSGGTGLGAWSVSNGSRSNPWNAYSAAGTTDPTRLPGFTGVDSGDYFARRSAASGASEMNSAISADLVTPGTVYFSLLINAFRVNTGNNFEMILGTDKLIDTGTPGAMMTAGGEGIGFGLNDTTLHAYIYDESGGVTTGTESSGSITVSGGGLEGETFMIVGELTWGATDTLNLYSITEGTDTLPGSAFATVSGDLNESAFDLLAIGDKQNASIDEIRFGTELVDVMPQIIPEPATLGMITATAMGILFIRRRFMI